MTEYAGADTPDGGSNSPQFESNCCSPSDLSHYDFIDPSTSMILTLVTGGSFDAGTSFFFLDTDYVCTGTTVSVCDNYEVGITPGAIGTSPVTIAVSFTTPTSSSATPEPSSLLLLGTGLLGLGASFRRKLLGQ